MPLARNRGDWYRSAMAMLELDDSTFDRLCAEASRRGITPAALVGRLLEESAARPRKARRTRLDEMPVPDDLSPESLRDNYPQAIQRFVILLAWLNQRHPDPFPVVESVTGGRRVYFARDPAAILESGRSTAPVRIPGSQYWVATNLSNLAKEQIVERVLAALGHGSDQRRRWTEALAGGERESAGAGTLPSVEDDDPNFI